MFRYATSSYGKSHREKDGFVYQNATGTGNTDSINNARFGINRTIRSEVKKLNMKYIETLFRFYRKNPVIKRAEEMLSRTLFQQVPKMFWVDDPLEPTPEFKYIIEHYYIEFIQDAHVCERVMGLIPMQLMLHRSGYMVPKVVTEGTYTIHAHHDYVTEQTKYYVTRKNMMFKGTEGTVGADGTNFNFDNGESGSSSLSNVNNTDGVNLMRVDFGLQFPQNLSDIDPTIHIIAISGKSPLPTSELRSDIHYLYIDYRPIHEIEKIIFADNRERLGEEPFLESTDLTEEQRNLGSTQSIFSNEGQNDAEIDRNRYRQKARHRRAVEDIERAIAFNNKRDEIQRLQEQLLNYYADDLQHLSMEEREQMKDLDPSVPRENASLMNRVGGKRLLLGERVANLYCCKCAAIFSRVAPLRAFIASGIPKITVAVDSNRLTIVS